MAPYKDQESDNSGSEGTKGLWPKVVIFKISVLYFLQMKSPQVAIPTAVDQRASQKQVLYEADNQQLPDQAVLLGLLKAQIKVNICLKYSFDI